MGFRKEACFRKCRVGYQSMLGGVHHLLDACEALHDLGIP